MSIVLRRILKQNALPNIFENYLIKIKFLAFISKEKTSGDSFGDVLDSANSAGRLSQPNPHGGHRIKLKRNTFDSD